MSWFSYLVFLVFGQRKAPGRLSSEMTLSQPMPFNLIRANPEANLLIPPSRDKGMNNIPGYYSKQSEPMKPQSILLRFD
jgi:hypothetical protein